MTTAAQTLRLSKKALFDDLGYKPHAGQLLVHRSTARRRVLACGVRWGKSMCASMEAIAALMEPRPKSLGWLVAPTYDLTDRIFKRVTSIVQMRFPHRVIEYSRRDHRIVLCNGAGGVSELRAKSADRPESLLGESLDYLVVDEAATLNGDLWSEHLAPRLIDKHGWALLVSTPRGCNWFFEQYRLGGHDPDYEGWRAASSQNPHIASSDLEAERARLSPEIHAQQYQAQFIGLPLVPCRVCGGPAEGVEHFLIVNDGEAARRCSACGGYLHETERTAVGIVAGKPVTQVIIERGIPYTPSELAEMAP